MQFFNTLISAFLLTAAAVAQSDVTVHVVQVGANGTLTYSPDTLTANPGEIVQFHFMAKNHSVVQSAFSSPCAPINTVMSNVTGFKSGFMPVTNTIPVFSIMINDTKPIWAYCSQTMHCVKGMVMAINPPTSGNKTFDAFKTLAMSSANSTSSTGSSSTSSSSGSSGSSDSGSSSTSSGSAASSSSAVPKAGDGSKPMVNMALLMLVGVFGLFFAGL